MAAKSFATIGGLKTHYLHAGHGPTLILLHGQLPGSSAEIEFGATVDHFAGLGYAVYAPDLAGFGLTDNPADYAIEARIAHAGAFIDFVGPTTYSIWGCSMGTYIGAQIALDDARVERLIIMPSNALPPPAAATATRTGPNVGAIVQRYTPTQENARALLTHVLVDHSKLTDDLVAAFCAASSGKNETAEHGRRAAPRPKPLHGELHRLRVPSLLLWGADDPGATPERAVALMNAIPGAELHLLRQCGHWPQHDQPARTYHLANDFLRPNS